MVWTASGESLYQFYVIMHRNFQIFDLNLHTILHNTMTLQKKGKLFVTKFKCSYNVIVNKIHFEKMMRDYCKWF